MAKTLLFITLIVSLLTGCAKENSNVFTPYPGNVQDTTWVATVPPGAPVKSLPALFAYPPFISSFNNSVNSTVHVSNLLDITIPAGSCIFANGTAVTGTISLEVIHLKSKGDFIRYARPTTSFGYLIESGGAFYLKAQQQGQEVLLKTNSYATIKFKSPRLSPLMRVFYGVENLQPPLPAGTNPEFTWTPSTDSVGVPLTTQDSGYNMNTTKFSWVNCDYFIDSTLPKTTFTAILPANFTNTNTSAFLVFKQQKIVVRLSANFATKTFSAPNIPINSQVTLVVLSKLGDELFKGSKDISISNNIVERITPVKSTQPEIVQMLDSL
ncbi:MAG TPA: hypothetical protein VF623_08940 [Segetibacter sp.]